MEKYLFFWWVAVCPTSYCIVLTLKLQIQSSEYNRLDYIRDGHQVEKREKMNLEKIQHIV